MAGFRFYFDDFNIQTFIEGQISFQTSKATDQYLVTFPTHVENRLFIIQHTENILKANLAKDGSESWFQAGQQFDEGDPVL